MLHITALKSVLVAFCMICAILSTMKRDIYSDEVKSVCERIAASLRSLRINEMNEKQDVMAKRIGVSRDTYIRMEKGDLSVKIGYWIEAARITQTLDQWKNLFEQDEDLFADFEGKKKERQRVRS